MNRINKMLRYGQQVWQVTENAEESDSIFRISHNATNSLHLSAAGYLRDCSSEILPISNPEIPQFVLLKNEHDWPVFLQLRSSIPCIPTFETEPSKAFISGILRALQQAIVPAFLFTSEENAASSRLAAVRQEIQEWNQEWIDLLKKRRTIIQRMKQIKSEEHIAAFQPDAYSAQLAYWIDCAHSAGFSAEMLVQMYELLHQDAVSEQETK